jgi:galactokinase
MALETALHNHRRAFHEQFPRAGAGPARLFFAPGRVNLMGAHLDYNGGPVMPTAIDRGTFIAARLRTDAKLVLASTLDSTSFEHELDRLPRTRLGRWSDYPLGVALEMSALAAERGVRLPGVEILFGGNLPVGAGLSSSASICVGTAFALNSLAELAIERMELVHVALRAERGFVGVQCGIMDPYAVGLARAGSLLWLDCKDRSLAYLPLDATRISIAVADTLVRRELAQGAFNERVEQCGRAFQALRAYHPGSACLRDIPLAVLDAHAGELAPEIAARARHVIEEVARTFIARSALERADPAGFGAEMFRAHTSLRDLFEVSVPELDRLVESAAVSPGCLGARLTGAGFGGCVVAVLEQGAEEAVLASMRSDFRRRFGHEPVIELFGTDPGPRELAA